MEQRKHLARSRRWIPCHHFIWARSRPWRTQSRREQSSRITSVCPRSTTLDSCQLTELRPKEQFLEVYFMTLKLMRQCSREILCWRKVPSRGITISCRQGQKLTHRRLSQDWAILCLPQSLKEWRSSQESVNKARKLLSKWCTRTNTMDQLTHRSTTIKRFSRHTITLRFTDSDSSWWEDQLLAFTAASLARSIESKISSDLHHRPIKHSMTTEVLHLRLTRTIILSSLWGHSKRSQDLQSYKTSRRSTE